MSGSGRRVPMRAARHMATPSVRNSTTSSDACGRCNRDRRSGDDPSRKAGATEMSPRPACRRAALCQPMYSAAASSSLLLPRAVRGTQEATCSWRKGDQGESALPDPYILRPSSRVGFRCQFTAPIPTRRSICPEVLTELADGSVFQAARADLMGRREHVCGARLRPVLGLVGYVAFGGVLGLLYLFDEGTPAQLGPGLQTARTVEHRRSLPHPHAPWPAVRPHSSPAMYSPKTTKRLFGVELPFPSVADDVCLAMSSLLIAGTSCSCVSARRSHDQVAHIDGLIVSASAARSPGRC